MNSSRNATQHPAGPGPTLPRPDLLEIRLAAVYGGLNELLTQAERGVDLNHSSTIAALTFLRDTAAKANTGIPLDLLTDTTTTN